MNFTAMVGGNFSQSIVNCYLFGKDWYAVKKEHYESFTGFGSYITAFLFNQMGNALSFKDIFDEIEEDKENQYYTDIAYQYGRLIRKIFDFQSIESSWLESFSVFDEVKDNSDFDTDLYDISKNLHALE
jgi:hypothetical protein